MQLLTETSRRAHIQRCLSVSIGNEERGMALFEKVFGDQHVPMKAGIMQGCIAVNISQIDLCFARDQLETERRSSQKDYNWASPYLLNDAEVIMANGQM